ncbi:hypothetical protein [Streptomyces sp. NPDC059819]|uniref:hypothetical protein n=1 Tax=Streptomyces sp. NPDC059819 TaxID=3346963 RepID=UPI00364B6CA2
MRAVLLYTVAWGITAAVVWRCWTKWRSGADRLWAERWGALAGALFLLGFSVTITLPLFVVNPTVQIALCLSPLMASGGCMVAKWVTIRRADTATRTMHGLLGLPLARRLWSPATVGALWFSDAVACLLGWMSVTTVARATDGRQHTDTEQYAAINQDFAPATVLVYAVLALGAAHVVIQIVRHMREQQHVRAAEQLYLSSHLD